MEIERNTRWIVDPKSPEGVRECEVLSVETGYTNGIYGMLGYVIFDLLYENYPETKTVRCMNKQKRIVNTEEDYIMWEMKHIIEKKMLYQHIKHIQQ